ncbi:protein SFI1 homolog isoform X2 [Cheilinus undulatus]|uniref:protein SFI1 homolog isoform X2 n=1 Tax=Cheilinus undulatus TaxID=241271 RepID=UPI001BD600D7|nr:protein SFI1 homolog isoform X2 [Cheilinus undulatus]
MQTNTRKPHPVKLRPNTVSAAGPSKQVCKGHTRKVPYRVGYSWNKGGRLKELRIRHLARKSLKIWIQRTFGRVLPHKAKFHYNSVVLRRAFEGWRDEWWTSRREWSLIMRAECHYRYYLCNLVFQQWRIFVSLQREKKCKLQKARLIADRQWMRQVWNCWEVFTDMKRIKKKMLESALELNKLTTLHSTWRLWQVRLQQRHEFYTLEDQAVKHRQLTLKHKSWLLWTEMHTAALDQKEKESKALLHFTLSLKRKTLHQWKCSVSCIQTKKASQAVALQAYHYHLLMMCWSEWKSALHRKQSEEDQLQAAGHLAVQSTKRRAVHRWKAYVALCREKAEKAKIASQHYHHHLLHAGFHGFSLNVTMKQTQRLNNNMAIQQYHQTLTTKYWRLWQDRIEQAEDRSYKQLTEMALTKHSTSLLSSWFQHWREKHAEQRHMQEMEHRADICFAERILPRCFNSWVEFTLQRRLNKQRKHKALVFNQQRQYTWVFYTWWGRSEQHKEQMLSERMAILHEERSCLQRSWSHWRQRTKQRIIEEEKWEASERLYKHRLLHKTMTEWKDNSMEIRDRRNREQQACHQGDVCCMRWAVDKWKKYVHSQRVMKSRLQQMQRFHEVKLLKHTFEAWKKRTRQMFQLCGHAEELYRQQKENFCRKVLYVWRENAVLMAEVRLMEQRAQSHFEHVLQFKVFLSWREATQHAVSRRHQQRETASRAQRSLNEVRLLRSLRHWRKQTRAARRERICMEKARKHHESKRLSKAVKAWKEHHYQCCKNKVMKRQGILLLRLKMYQTYFEQWRVKLQHRRREAQQTERALWHWSLSLQAKVLCGWRLWALEQRRKQEQVVQAAQVYRDQLLREGVTCILTYAAHMNDLTKNLTQHSQEQKSQRLHRVVRRCALRWKQQALNKPQREQEVKTQPPKKSVTFSLTETKSVSSSDSGEQEAEDGELSQLLLSRTHRRQPHRCEELFKSPVKMNSWMYSVSTGAALKPSQLNPEETGHTVLFNIPSANGPVTSIHQSATISNLPTSTTQVSTKNCSQGNQDVLLPPSAFMTFGTEDTFGGVPLIPPSKQQSPVHPDKPQGAARGVSLEEAVMDSTSTLTGELLSIQLDMKMYQQDRKQLRAWQKLRGVLQSWLQTSGKEEKMERTAVCEELKELEERIHRLSAELGKRKPTMLLHAERIQHLQTVLHASGVPLLFKKAEDELCLLRDAHTHQE